MSHGTFFNWIWQCSLMLDRLKTPLGWGIIPLQPSLLPICGCLVFSSFLSECVRPGKLPSLFVPQFRWQIDFDSVNTDRLSDTDPDSTGATPLLPLAPPPLKLCLHTLLLQWKGPVSSLLSVLSSSLRLAGAIVVVACGGSGGNSEKNDRNAVQLLASLLYGLWFACSDAAMTSLWTPKRLLTTSRLSCMSTSFAMWLFFKMTSSCKSAKSKFSLLEQLSSFWSSCWVFFLSRCDGSLMPNEECFFVLFF